MTDSTEKKEAQQHRDDEWLQVESLDLDAQGVAHKADGMVVFIEGALPFEEVQFKRAPQEEQLGAGHGDRDAPRIVAARAARAARTSACTPAPAAAARCSTSMPRRRSR